MTAKEFIDSLVKFDWFYEMSDDNRVFKAGEAEKHKIILAIKTNPEFEPLYNNYARHKRNGEPLSQKVQDIINS